VNRFGPFVAAAVDLVDKARPIVRAICMLHRPPWACPHAWRLQPATPASPPARSCVRCNVAEPLWSGQPPLHPESMLIELPKWCDEYLAALERRTWPEEAL
jgi:hypothetical protein